MQSLTNISEIKRLMESHGITFNKQFGQNFLIQPAIPKRIAEQCGALHDEGILEIGPGIGTLTVELAERYQRVVAVEIDHGLIPILDETLAQYNNVTVLNQDIMKTDLRELLRTSFPGMNVSVCANLPYYITTPILMLLLESGCRFRNITVMVQKEVAQRLTASPGDPQYGAITAAVQYYGQVSRLFDVPAGCFMPAPKVDSAVIRIALFDTPPVSVTDQAMLSRVIKGAFAQRRKTLVNSLASVFSEWDKETLSAMLKEAGYSAQVRGETLGTSDFAAIANLFSTKKNAKKA